MKPNIIGAIEISSRAVKYVVGYVLDGEVVVLKKAMAPLDEKAVIDGEIRDSALVNKAISQAIKEGESSLNDSVSKYVVIVPPLGFEVFEHSQTTSVVSPVGKIAKLDIENVISQVSKAKTTDGSMIIDILPDAFILDQGQTHMNPPIGETSNSVTIKAKLHVLPIHLVQSHKKAYRQANIQYAKMLVAPYCALAIAKQSKTIPNDFLLIDIGARMTTISLIGSKQVIASTFEYRGLDSITEKLVSQFEIEFKNAQQLKELFGFDEQEYAFKAPLFTVVNKDKKEKRNVNYADWREAVGNAIHEYANELSYSIHELATQFGGAIPRLPIILVGGGTQFHGLSSMLKEQLECKDLHMVVPTSLGARNPTFTNCLGAILIVGSEKPLEDMEEETSPTGEKTRKIKTTKVDMLDDEL